MLAFKEYSVERDLYNYTFNFLDPKFYDYGRKARSGTEIAPVLWDDIHKALGTADDLSTKQSIAEAFLRDYAEKHHAVLSRCLAMVSEYWDGVEAEFLSKATGFFELGDYAPEPVKVYLTTLNVCSYNTEERFFFIPFVGGLPRQAKVIMHELFHFLFLENYRGYLRENGMSGQDILDINEALVCMLNLLFRDNLMLPERDYKPAAEPLKRRTIEMYERGVPFGGILEDLIAYKKSPNQC